eukprot:jgi/Tetstr1/430952/TSEL_020707.t2
MTSTRRDNEYDVIVCGLGAMGAATAYHLAKRGIKVLGLEQFRIAHDRGSSHGLSRIIRKAYFEHPSYVPLLEESYRLWQVLEAEVGAELLTVTGALDLVRCSTAAAELHGLPYEVLTGAEVNARFPGYCLPEHFSAFYQPDSGILAAEDCVSAHAAVARQHGARLLEGVRLADWRVLPSGGVAVTCADGSTFEARKLVLCSGPWIAQQVPELQELAVPERQVVGWFPHRSAAHFSPAAFPVFILDDAEATYYGFPEFRSPGCMKLGRFGHLREVIRPQELGEAVTEEDVKVMRRALERYFPSVSREPERCGVCMFTNSIDSDFILDRHPQHPEQVLLCSPCSGHGFKMSPVIGSIMADLAQHGSTAHDIRRHTLVKQHQALRARRARAPKAALRPAAALPGVPRRVACVRTW